MTKSILLVLSVFAFSTAAMASGTDSHNHEHGSENNNSAPMQMSAEDCAKHRNMDMSRMSSEQHAGHMDMMAACDAMAEPEHSDGHAGHDHGAH